MDSTQGQLVPEGQYPPFRTITPDDHSAWIIIAGAFGLTCSLFFAGIRILVRTHISHGVGIDDYTLFAATALYGIQSALVLGACSKGLGRSVDIVSASAQDEVAQLYYASNLFFILAIGLSKVSVVYFLLRISRAKHHQVAFKIAVGLLGLWTVGSFLAIALQCNLAHPWISIGEACTGIARRWEVVCALDIATEIGIVALVIYLVYTLKTSMSSKMMVVSIFSFRLLLVIFIAFRLHTFDAAAYTTNPFLREAEFICLTQAQLSYALVSATIPTFQNFLKNLNTGFGGYGASEGGYGYGYGGSNGSRGRKDSNMAYQMSNMKSANKSMRDDADDEDIKPMNGPSTLGKGLNKSDRNGSENLKSETMSIGSNESRRMMITKDIQWSVRTEHV